MLAVAWASCHWFLLNRKLRLTGKSQILNLDSKQSVEACSWKSTKPLSCLTSLDVDTGCAEWITINVSINVQSRDGNQKTCSCQINEITTMISGLIHYTSAVHLNTPCLSVLINLFNSSSLCIKFLWYTNLYLIKSTPVNHMFHVFSCTVENWYSSYWSWQIQKYSWEKQMVWAVWFGKVERVSLLFCRIVHTLMIFHETAEQTWNMLMYKWSNVLMIV